MRVLIVHSRYLSGPASGENRVAEEEARLLQDGGHDVEVFSPAPSDQTKSKARLAAKAVWSLEGVASVVDLISSHRAEIVHFHNLFPMVSPASIRAASKARVGVVMTLHNYRMMCLPATLLRDGATCELCVGKIPWRGVKFGCYRGSVGGSAALATSLSLHREIGSFAKVDRFLAVSRFVKDKHVESGMDPSRIDVRPNFAWGAEPRSGVGEYFLFLGRLSSEKGVTTLVKAWRKELGRLIVAGDGPQASQLRQVSPEGVDFLGTVPSAEIPGLLAGARALLVPSQSYEGAPRSIVEAYAAGVPVIASDIGGLSESVQEDISGYLVPPGDERALSNAMTRLLDEEVSSRLSAGALDAWRTSYSPESGLESLEEVYAKILSKKFA